MARSLSGSWGGLANGRLNVSNPNYGEGYCGDNTVVTNITPVSIYQQCGSYRRGFTAFHYGVTGDDYGYCLTSNGQAFTFVPNVYKSVDVRGMYIDKDNASAYEPVRYVICGSLNRAVLPDNVVPVGVAGNDLFNGSDGKYYRYDGEIVNIPSGVTVQSEPFEGIYLGSDNKYYDVHGEVFGNLPSGVIPVTEYAWGAYQGSDGKFYDVNGDEILGDLPSGVLPVDTLGETYIGTDGNYYKSDGDEAFENLPEGVNIVGYDSENDTYQGSDGKDYDINGDEFDPSSQCDGELLQYGNTFRLAFTGVDVFGNDFTFTRDVNPSVNTIVLDSSTASTIRKIDRITIRNLNSGYSTGNTRLKISSRVVGFRVGIDIDTIDPDFVIGNFTVCDCLFHTCDKYADVVLNSDLPLGFVPNTSSLDVGIYCLIDGLWLEWSLDNTTQFPYCCGSYVETEKGSGSTPDNNDSSNSDIVEAIDKLTEAVKELSCLVEVVVSPAEDVNIYNRRFHYNDTDGVSGFHE